MSVLELNQLQPELIFQDRQIFLLLYLKWFCNFTISLKNLHFNMLWMCVRFCTLCIYDIITYSIEKYWPTIFVRQCPTFPSKRCKWSLNSIENAGPGSLKREKLSQAWNCTSSRLHAHHPQARPLPCAYWFLKVTVYASTNALHPGNKWQPLIYCV